MARKPKAAKMPRPRNGHVAAMRTMNAGVHEVSKKTRRRKDKIALRKAVRSGSTEAYAA